jgi:hypothetical protein
MAGIGIGGLDRGQYIEGIFGTQQKTGQDIDRSVLTAGHAHRSSLGAQETLEGEAASVTVHEGCDAYGPPVTQRLGLPW